MKNSFLIYAVLVSILILILIFKAMSKDEEPEVLKGNIEELKRVIKKRSD